MQPFLEDFIDTLTNRGVERVQAVLEDAKIGKEQVKIIAQRLSDFRDFATLIFTTEVFGDLISSGTISVNIRDLSLQMQEMYRIDNEISDLISGSKAIFSSQISTLEKEIAALEKQIQNYGFLLSDGGYFDYAYMETFNDALNMESFDWSIPDRASQYFGPAENAEVRTDEGVLSIAQYSRSTSITAQIVKSNASAFVSVNNGIENATKFTSEQGWRYVVASPNPVTSSLAEAGSVTGAQILVEFALNEPSISNEIKITPFAEHPIQIVKVVAYETMADSQGYEVVKNPVVIDKPLSLQFEARTVAKFQVLISQNVYERTAEVVTGEIQYRNIADASDAYRKYNDNNFLFHPDKNKKRNKPKFNDDRFSHLYFIIRQRLKRLLDRNQKRNLSNLNGGNGSPLPKRLPINFGDLSKIPIRREKDINYIYGKQDPSKFWNGDSPHLKVMSKMLLDFFDDRDVSLANYPAGQIPQILKSDLFKNPLLSTLYGDKNLDYQKIRPLASFIISQFRDVANFHTQQDGPAQNILTKANIYPAPMTSSVSSYKYQYFLGLEQISIGYSTPGQKAVFVTKPFSSVGDIGEIRLKSSEKNVVDNNILINQPLTSVEYSVSKVSDPNEESDWIPILPVDQSQVTGERFFPSSAGSGYFRFPALRSENIFLRKNGQSVNLDVARNYIYDASGVHVIGINLPNGELSDLDIYTVDYYPSPIFSTINFEDRGFNEVPLINVFSSDSAGESFTGTNGSTTVTLSYYPYVDEEQIQSNIASGQSVGPYEPVVVVLADGTIAGNITSYTKATQEQLNTNDSATLTYIHRGNLLIFNKPISQAFKVYYQYLKNNVRLRIVLRANAKQFVAPKVDFVQVKAKTRRPNRAEVIQ